MTSEEMYSDCSAINGIYVLYYDSEIHYAGTKEECKKALDYWNKEYPLIKNWQITSTSDYGSFCYELGREGS